MPCRTCLPLSTGKIVRFSSLHTRRPDCNCTESVALNCCACVVQGGRANIRFSSLFAMDVSKTRYDRGTGAGRKSHRVVFPYVFICVTGLGAQRSTSVCRSRSNLTCRRLCRTKAFHKRRLNRFDLVFGYKCLLKKIHTFRPHFSVTSTRPYTGRVFGTFYFPPVNDQYPIHILRSFR